MSCDLWHNLFFSWFFYMYHILSLIKIIVWLIVCSSLFVTIDPYRDPLIAIIGAMIGVFLVAWWWSFYIFYGRKKLAFRETITNTIIVESYKLSLLFWLYCLTNILFLLRQQWTILWGLLLLIWFAIIQSILVPQKK